MGNNNTIDISGFSAETTKESDLSDENLAKYAKGDINSDMLRDLISDEILHDAIVGATGHIGSIN